MFSQSFVGVSNFICDSVNYQQWYQKVDFPTHVKGFEVNTTRIGVIIANYYDLPFADVLNWKSFSVVVTTLDIQLGEDMKELQQW